MGGNPALSRERVRAVLDCLAAGMNGMQASRATGVSKSAAYRCCTVSAGCAGPAVEAANGRVRAMEALGRRYLGDPS